MTLEDPTTGRAFPNFVADLAVLTLPDDRFDWRWVDARRKPSLTVEQTLAHAPASWNAWIAAGGEALQHVRRLE